MNLKKFYLFNLIINVSYLVCKLNKKGNLSFWGFKYLNYDYDLEKAKYGNIVIYDVKIFNQKE